VEPLAERDLRGDAGDRVPRGLRRQRRGPGDPGVYLHDPVLPAGRAVVPPGELDVTPSLDPEVADHLQCRGPHVLVALVGDHL
jgi:hypothetical protein